MRTIDSVKSGLRLVLTVGVWGTAAACGSHDTGEVLGADGDPVSTTFTLLVSTSSARTSPVPLSGTDLTGAAYVFTSDGTHTPNPPGIEQVQYWLDDPSMKSAPTHVEHYTAYDFVGTAGNGSAEAWDTSKITNGTHTITQSVTPVSGSVQNVTATFSVGKVVADGGAGSDGGHDGGADGGGPPACPGNAVALSTYGKAGQGGDDTAVFQSAIDSTAKAHETLHIPVGQTSYHVGPLTISSNASICMDSGVDVEARSGYGPFDVMVAVNGASNVEILGYGATLHMAPSEWMSDPDPEYRHCITVIGSSNVHVAGMRCVTFGGDGLYLGGNSANVLAEDFTADGSARDGLTVISAKNSTIRRSHFVNGHTAVDMEPNVASDALDNVVLEDSDSTNNHYGGVNVSVYAYTAASTPPNVTVARHTDTGTGIGAADWHAGTSFSANGTNGVGLGGSILFDTCTSVNSGSRAAWVAWWTSNGPNVTFKNLSVTNPNQNKSAADGAAIAVGRGGGGSGDQGNSTFTGTSISANPALVNYYFTYYDGSNQPFSKVQFVNPGTLSGAAKAPPNGLLDGNGVNTVNQ
jgi:hypothetical protein